MSGETEKDPSAFTVDSLLVHFDRILAEMDKRYEQRFRAQEKEVTTATTAANERFALLNELRSDVATSAEVDAVEKQVLDVKDRLTAMENRSRGVGQSWAAIAAVVAAIVGVSSIVIAILVAIRQAG